MVSINLDIGAWVVVGKDSFILRFNLSKGLFVLLTKVNSAFSDTNECTFQARGLYLFIYVLM